VSKRTVRGRSKRNQFAARCRSACLASGIFRANYADGCNPRRCDQEAAGRLARRQLLSNSSGRQWFGTFFFGNTPKHFATSFLAWMLTGQWATKIAREPFFCSERSNAFRGDDEPMINSEHNDFRSSTTCFGLFSTACGRPISSPGICGAY
jgi:hypothetical protein